MTWVIFSWTSAAKSDTPHFRFETRAQARHAITAWIKHYNATRLHSSLGNLPSIEWELRYRLGTLQAA
ncbi:MAG: integrase core domain-containing protein [Acidimicrobiales bacterium]